MPGDEKLLDPWLVAVWPGMGGVALSAGYYLISKLEMHLLTEFPASEFFDLDQINIKNGLIVSKQLPRSRLFVWNDPRKQHDLIVFIGDAQPPARGGAFCNKLLEQAHHSVLFGTRWPCAPTAQGPNYFGTKWPLGTKASADISLDFKLIDAHRGARNRPSQAHTMNLSSRLLNWIVWERAVRGHQPGFQTP